MVSYSSLNSSGGSAGGAGAFVPAAGGERVALLVQGEGGEESAEQEGAFGVAEGSFVVAEAVGVAVDGEIAQVGVEGGDGAGIVGRNGSP